MHELLKQYITKEVKKQKEISEKEKNDYLLSKGLYEKIYSQSDSYSSEFPNSEWGDNNDIKYFKKAPIQVTDEEYKYLVELCEKKDENPKTNKVALTLTCISWFIMVCGFILGIVFATETTSISSYYSKTEFSFGTMLIWWGISFINGIFILGFAEIIKLLNAIKNK